MNEHRIPATGKPSAGHFTHLNEDQLQLILKQAHRACNSYLANAHGHLAKSIAEVLEAQNAKERDIFGDIAQCDKKIIDCWKDVKFWMEESDSWRRVLSRWLFMVGPGIEFNLSDAQESQLFDELFPKVITPAQEGTKP